MKPPKAQEEQRVKLAAERERKQREDARKRWPSRRGPRSPTSTQGADQSVAGRHLHRYQDADADRSRAMPDQPCDRDAAMLAQLRSNPTLEGVAQLEAGLTCEKLRAQVMRLRESLTSVANAAPGVAAQAKSAIAEKITPPPVVVAPPPAPKPEAAPKQEAVPTPPEPPKVAVATVAPTPGCKQDEARLAKIRANPSLADLAALERDLSCERLRPQIVRLRESLPKETAEG